jgi:S-adenosylmethionine:tRNA ribosyltransferase-isomerase
MLAQRSPLEFELPEHLAATEPPEARGLARDEVRLMVSRLPAGSVEHAAFRNLPEFLEAGDVLVVNTSATMNAALEARRSDGSRLVLHLSTRLPGGLWTVELRLPENGRTLPYFRGVAGETLELPAGGIARLLAPYSGSERLWAAALEMGLPVEEYLARYGDPIRYGYVRESWPLEYYQTVYATEPGSAEMPSAGRAFTPELVTRLVARGVQFAPLVLHTGVSSPESGEPPYEEFYRVPPASSRTVNAARSAGRRVIAVGTTAVRALETVAEPDGTAHPGEGWTGLVVTPERGVRAVDGLLTGLHEPRSSHLWMLEAVAGREFLELAYAEALREEYLWHEFGDLHLILPE